MEWKLKDIEKVRNLLSQGKSITAIARLFNAATNDIYQMCFANDISIREIRKQVKLRLQKQYEIEKKNKKREKLIAREKKDQEYKKALDQRYVQRDVKRWAELEEIASLRRKGLKFQEIADKFGITRERIRQKLERYNQGSDTPVDMSPIRSISVNIQKRREQVANLCRKGLSITEIAKKLNVVPCIISDDIKKYNKAAKEPVCAGIAKRIRSAKRRENVTKLYQSGWTQGEIAEKLKISRMTVVRDLLLCSRKNGIEIKKRSHLSEKDLQDMQKMQKSGATLHDIAKKYKVSSSTISKFLRKCRND
jgi:DNA-binding NarL/FixJ family response regulator